MKCYTFKELTFKYGLFDSFIDSTYIIHYENKNNKSNSNKLKNIQYQLKKYKPSKKLFIYINKDPKNCKNNFNLNKTYFNIFQHSLQKNYNHILILDEDFIFKRLILQEDISNINEFIKENEQNNFILSIGTFPLLYYMVNKNFNKSLLSLDSNCNIYSKQMRNYLLEKKNNYFNFNTYFNTYFYTYFNTYFYKKPLIYKRFDDKNKEKWNYFILTYMKLLNFKKKPEKAFEYTYKISYIFSNILFIFISIVLLFIIYSIYYLIANKNSNQNIDS